MPTKTYNITINAPREKVWSTLWEKDTYSDWTTAFAAGSRVETDWKEGSKVLFLDSNNRGMVSTVREKKTNEYMGITHLGNYLNGVEDLDSEEAKKWSGSQENYTLTEVDGKTKLDIEMSMTGELPKDMEDYFAAAWPKALARLKEISEAN